MAAGAASHACRRGSGSTRGFDFLFWGALLLFVLRVVARACVGRWTGQPTAAAGGAAARGVRGIGGFFCGWTGSRCGSGRLTTGVVRHACRLRRDGTRRFLVWGILSHAQERQHEGGVVWGDYFAVLWRTLSPFVLRVVAGACVGRGSGQPRMPPRERLHEGFDFFGLGNSFTPTGETRRVLMRVLFF